MTADIDIVPGVLREFAGSLQGDKVFQLESLASLTDTSGFQPSSLPESAAFGPALGTSTTEIKRFLTEVDQGLNWLAGGARKMADTYDETEHRVTTTLQRIPSQLGLPQTSPELQGQPDPRDNDVPPPKSPLRGPGTPGTL